MAMYANIGGVNKLLAQTFAEGSSSAGGGVVTISTSQTMPYQKYLFWSTWDGDIGSETKPSLGSSSVIGFVDISKSCILVLSTGSTNTNYESNKQFAMSRISTDGSLTVWRFCQAGSTAGQTECKSYSLGIINISTNYFTKDSSSKVANTVLYCVSL